MVEAIRQIASREVFRNRRLSVREDDIEFADGSPGSYTVVEKADFALVVPFTGDGFWLVEQYRYPLGRRTWEFPQGGWPLGHGGTPQQLAAAELREETGLRAERLEHLGRLDPAPGYATHGCDVFVATGLTEGAPEHEASEADMVHAHVSEAQLHGLIDRGGFRDSSSLAALLLMQLWRASGA